MDWNTLFSFQCGSENLVIHDPQWFLLSHIFWFLELLSNVSLKLEVTKASTRIKTASILFKCFFPPVHPNPWRYGLCH